MLTGPRVLEVNFAILYNKQAVTGRMSKFLRKQVTKANLTCPSWQRRSPHPRSEERHTLSVLLWNWGEDDWVKALEESSPGDHMYMEILAEATE